MGSSNSVDSYFVKSSFSGISTLIVKLNDKLNSYFSDFGWRMVRKELSQIKKRQKKSHIELSKDLIIQLKEYMGQHSLDSFDQAIDNLLVEAEGNRDIEN